MAARPWETAYLDECEEKPTDEGVKRQGHLKAEDELEKKHPPLKNPTSEILHENSQQLNLPELPSSSWAENPVHTQQGETLTSYELSTKPQTLTSTISSRLMKPTKSSSSKSTSNPNASAALEAHSETMEKGLQDGSTSNVKHDHFPREALPVEPMPKNKGVFKRHSFSGPLKGLQENPMSNSPTIPSYMAVTQSAKAKARSQSNPKLRPDLDEKTSPVSKRRTSLPAQLKPNSIPWQTFRSASTKGFSSIRSSSRAGGG